MCGCLSHTPPLGTWPKIQAKLGIEPTTLWFTGQHSIHQATPARAIQQFYLKKEENLQREFLEMCQVNNKALSGESP